MDGRREIVERLERSAIRYFVTGSEAMALHAIAFRFTNDIDVVLDIDPAAYEHRIRPLFEPDFLVNDLTVTPRRWLGSAISIRAVAKVDFVIRRPDPWGREALERRIRIDDPGLGPTWVSSVEDLVLAKLEWADGDLSGLQGRDLARIIETVRTLDVDYLRRHAPALGLADDLERLLGR